MTVQAEQSQARGDIRGPEAAYSGTISTGARRPGLAESAAEVRGRVMAMFRENLSTIVIMLTILGSIPLFINPRFDALDAKLSARIDALEASVNARFESVDARFESVDARFESLEASLIARIDAVDAKIDHKFNNLANMMIVANTNGEVTAAELIAIWEQVKTE